MLQQHLAVNEAPEVTPWTGLSSAGSVAVARVWQVATLLQRHAGQLQLSTQQQGKAP